jgi:hypothetical protein
VTITGGVDTVVVVHGRTSSITIVLVVVLVVLVLVVVLVVLVVEVLVVLVVVVGRVTPTTSLLHEEYTPKESLSARTLNSQDMSESRFSTTASVVNEAIAKPVCQPSQDQKTAYLSGSTLDCSGASHER